MLWLTCFFSHNIEIIEGENKRVTYYIKNIKYKVIKKGNYFFLKDGGGGAYS